MWPTELDRYYTPPAVARSVVEAAGESASERCLDSTCGDGSLLAAAKDILPNVRCVGIDVDHAAISRLRRRYPDWTLSRGDALDEKSWARLHAGRVGIGADLALLNPPFSMAATKGVIVRLEDFNGRCSVAMAHVLTVLTRALPTVCCAVLPESLMYSELDAQARSIVSRGYDTTFVAQLRNSTFRGTRANALVARFTRKSHVTVADGSKRGMMSSSSVALIRGGLPVYEAQRAKQGVSYVHSTDLSSLARDVNPATLGRVHGIERGRVSGDVIFLPRVGLPLRENVRAIILTREVQLSDCVIALSFRSRAIALLWERALRNVLWSELVAQYHGTGARYVTVAALQSWLSAAEVRVH